MSEKDSTAATPFVKWFFFAFFSIQKTGSFETVVLRPTPLRFFSAAIPVVSVAVCTNERDRAATSTQEVR